MDGQLIRAEVENYMNDFIPTNGRYTIKVKDGKIVEVKKEGMGLLWSILKVSVVALAGVVILSLVDSDTVKSNIKHK